MPLLFDAEHRPIASRDGLEPASRGAATSLGALPRRRSPVRVLAIDRDVLDEDRPEGVIRQLIRYETERGLAVEGYLLRPDRPGRGRPGVVVLAFHRGMDDPPARRTGGPGRSSHRAPARTAGLRRDVSPLLHLAVPPRGQAGDGRGMAARPPPGVTGMAKMLYDATRAVDLLASMEDVDPHRIGAIGHSLGAKEVLYLAAFDERVRAAVSSEGGIGLTYSNWDAPWYLGEAIRRPGFGLDHGQVLALAAPRAFLLIGGDSADGDRSWPYIAEACPLWKLAGAPDAVGLFNHRRGHAFPPEARSVRR